MRYEAKYNLFKTQLKSFKNITKTLARKHQKYMALHWESFSLSRVTIGPGKMLQLTEVERGPEIAARLNVDTSTNVLLVKRVKHYGSEYRTGLVVCLEMCEELPVFCKISAIVIKDEQVVFTGTVGETICFDEHYYAFKIVCKPSQALKVFSAQELIYFKPMDVQMAYGPEDLSLFVVPYCHMMQP